jgi:hypothetical protein
MLHLKRQKEVFLAVQSLLKEGYDLHLNYYGHELDVYSDYISNVKELAEKEILRGRVAFHGYVDDPTEIARDNHIIVSASAEESIPQGMINYQAGGLVPVACPAGGIEEVVREGETGFLANGFSVEELTQALRSALERRSDWPRLIARGRAFLVEQCSEQIFARKILKIIQDGIDIHLSEGRRFFHESTWDRVKLQVSRLDKSQQNVLQKSYEILTDVSVSMENPGTIGPDLCRSATHYHFQPGVDRLAGFAFQVGTFMTQPEGQLYLTVTTLEDYRKLREVMLDASALRDNRWMKVVFDPIINSKNRQFIITARARLKTGRIAFFERLAMGESGAYWRLRLLRKLRRFLGFPIGRPGHGIVPFYD